MATDYDAPRKSEDESESIEALKERFPNIIGPDVRDICYATQNRQAAVRELSSQVDLILVIGAQNSSNSNRLAEIGNEMGIKSHLIDDARSFDDSWLDGIETVGVSAGASAPEKLIQDLIAHLGTVRDITVTTPQGTIQETQEQQIFDPGAVTRLVADAGFSCDLLASYGPCPLLPGRFAILARKLA